MSDETTVPVLVDRRRLRQLRRHVRGLLRAMDLRSPLDVDDLARRYGALRGRRIVLTARADIPMSVAYALWLETTDADHVLYQEATSVLHRRHHILHEIGHMMAGHGADETGLGAVPAGRTPDGGLALVRAMMPTLPPDLIRTALRRHAYDTVQEQEAEFIGGLILQWASDLDVRPVQPADPSVLRLDTAMGDRRGWL